MTERPIRDASVTLLAWREHSQGELQRKLAARGYTAEAIEIELAELVELGLQSDERYAQSRARSRANRGYGPMLIRQDLRQHGVPGGLATAALNSLDVDWYATAAEQRRKKFGDDLPSDLPAKAKQQRFLQRRGFDHDQIRAALNSA